MGKHIDILQAREVSLKHIEPNSGQIQGLPKNPRVIRDAKYKLLLKSAEHPTMKPLKLIGRQVRNSARPGEIVLDLFGGSGSTMMAAEQLSRRCFMVEFDPKYVDVIVKRWEDLTGKQSEYLGNMLQDGNSTNN